MVEHLTFNQVVRGSNPRTLTVNDSGNTMIELCSRYLYWRHVTVWRYRIILVDINFFSVYCFYLQKMVRKLYNMDIGTGYELIWMNHHMDMVQNTVVCPSEEE